MKYHKLKTARVLLLMGIGAAIAIGAQGLLPFHLIVIVGLFLLMVLGTRRGFLWGTIAGLLYEAVSPLPPFVFMAALFGALGACSLVLAKYVSHRTFFGALVIGGLGSTLYELFSLLFSHIGAHLGGDGWMPLFDWHYAKFILLRAIFSALALGLLVLLAKRASPEVRGIMITHQR